MAPNGSTHVPWLAAAGTRTTRRAELVGFHRTLRNTTTNLGGEIAFSLTQEISVGAEPRGIAAGLLHTGGTVNDLVVGNYLGNSVTVLFNDPNNPGGFQVAATYPAGTKPFFLALGQFTSSGNLDLVTANAGSNDVSLLLGNGDGTFRPAISLSTGGNGCSGIAVGQFTNSGNLDLVVSNADSDTVSVLLGNGDGTFTLAPGSPIAVGVNPTGVAVGSLRASGVQDIVVANFASDQPAGSISVLLGNGDGTFAAPANYDAGAQPLTVALGNFRGDNRLDIAVTNFDYPAHPLNSNVHVFLNNGDGSFGPSSVYQIDGPLPAGVAAGDFNGDGFPDLAVTSAFPLFGGNTVQILRNDAVWPAPPPARSPGDGERKAESPPAAVNDRIDRPVVVWSPNHATPGGNLAKLVNEVSLWLLHSPAGRKTDDAGLLALFGTEEFARLV